MAQRIFILLTAMAATALCCLGCARVRSEQQSPPEEVPLTLYLLEASAKLRFYCTLESEEAVTPGVPMLYFRSLTRDKAPTSIEALIRNLRQKLPDCTVVRNRKNPAILHIIETSLTKKKDYVVEQKVTLIIRVFWEEWVDRTQKRLAADWSPRSPRS